MADQTAMALMDGIVERISKARGICDMAKLFDGEKDPVRPGALTEALWAATDLLAEAENLAELLGKVASRKARAST